jgi:ribose transport system permease protein
MAAGGASEEGKRQVSVSGPEGVRADEHLPGPPPSGERERAEAAAAKDGTRLYHRFGGNIGLIGVLVLLALVGGLTKPSEFLVYNNIVVILTQASVIGVISVGMTYVIIGGGIDLSVGAIVALATVWATTKATQVYGTGGVIFCAIAVGVGCGLVNGLVIAYGRIVAFIVTLAMLASARGLATNISGGHTQTLSAEHQGLVNLGFKDAFLFGKIPPLVLIFAAVVVVGWVVLNRTTFGRRTFAIGGNPEASRLAGLNVKRHTLLLYVLSGLCCGIASIMLIIQTSSGTSANGNLYELDAIASVIIGGTLLSGGRGTLIGSLFGVLVFATLNNIFTQNNLNTATQQIAKGVIIVIAVFAQRLLAERRAAAGPA